MGKDIIVACDFSTKEDTFLFLDKFKDVKPFVKIGMELYYSEGPKIVKEIKARGHKIFLDLKLHDIPNTVKKAMNVLSKLNIDMCNLHASGTSKMMKAALEGITREYEGGKQFLAFSDIRSDAAFFASYLDKMYKEFIRRRGIYQVVHKLKDDFEE